ncbi:MAG: response regulator [Bacteroidota bacterium]
MNSGYRYHHVLLIENMEIDNYIACYLLEKYLVTSVITVKTNATDALEWLSSEMKLGHMLPDLIILDMKLPDMDGRELLRIMEEYPEEIKSKIKIVVASSIKDQREVDEIKNNPMINLFIPKPLNSHSMNYI